MNLDLIKQKFPDIFITVNPEYLDSISKDSGGTINGIAYQNLGAIILRSAENLSVAIHEVCHILGLYTQRNFQKQFSLKPEILKTELQYKQDALYARVLSVGDREAIAPKQAFISLDRSLSILKEELTVSWATSLILEAFNLEHLNGEVLATEFLESYTTKVVGYKLSLCTCDIQEVQSDAVKCASLFISRMA